MLLYDILFGTGCVLYLDCKYFCYYYIKKDKCFNKKNNNDLYYDHDPLTPDTNLVN